MILHLGSDVSVQTAEVISVIDLTGKQIGFTGDLLSQYRRQKRIFAKQGTVPKSAVICAGARKPGGITENPRVYLSAISTSTLAQRLSHTPFETVFACGSGGEEGQTAENGVSRDGNGDKNG